MHNIELNNVKFEFTNPEKTKMCATYKVPVLRKTDEYNVYDIGPKFILDRYIKINLHLHYEYNKFDIRYSKIHKIRKQIANEYNTSIQNIDMGSMYDTYGSWQYKINVKGIDCNVNLYENIRLNLTKADLRKEKIKNILEE